MGIGKVYEIDLGEVEVSFNPSLLNVVMVFSLVAAEKVQGSFHHDAASDHDYNGFSDLEFELLSGRSEYGTLTSPELNEVDLRYQDRISDLLWAKAEEIFCVT